ncbi:MAG: dTDP-4-dehydrorhamnose 3,5-epimerase [Brevinemataceae bacterium]
MNITKCTLEGVKILEPTYFEDIRGFAAESYSYKTLSSKGIYNIFVQDYVVLNSKKGTLIGIHYQNHPFSQAKIIRVLKGKILDVVDLRKNSPTYKQYIVHEISSDNRKQVFIPKGFRHAFITLEDNTEVFYKMDEYYASGFDGAILWNDPELNIDWGIENPILSNKDLHAPTLADSPMNC